jgi:hypothetical protein
VERIAQPDEFGGCVVDEEGAEGGLQNVVAPGGEEVAGGAMALGVTPVKVGNNKAASGLEVEGEAGIEANVGGDGLVDHGTRWEYISW